MGWRGGGYGVVGWLPPGEMVGALSHSEKRLSQWFKGGLRSTDDAHTALYAERLLFPATDDESGSKLANTETVSTMNVRGMSQAGTVSRARAWSRKGADE